MRFRLSISALLIALCGDALYGLDPNRTLTQYAHRIWQVQQGLPEPSIYSLLQTRDGYLWLGTQTGLVRFDGVQFTTLESIYPSAPANVWIRAVVEDSQGALWIGTNESGVFRIARGGAEHSSQAEHFSQVEHFSQKEGLPSNTVQCLVLLKDDVWACTPSGLARFSGGKISVYHAEDGLPSKDIRAAAAGADGKLWVGGDNAGLSVWNGSRFERHPLPSIVGDTSVRALAVSGDGVLWIGTTAGLIRLKNGVERLFTVKQDLADDWILTLASSHDGSVWIGTRNGFSRCRDGEIVSFRPKDGLSQSTVFSVYEDREGSLWVGTKLGLNQFLDGRATPYTVNEGLPTNETGPVLEGQHGNVWIGTLGAGLSRFDGHRFTTVTVKEGLASNFISALAEDPDGTLWVGTDHGLNRLRDGRVDQTFSTAQGLPANDVRGLMVDDSGVLWVATQNGAVALRNGRFERPPGIAVHTPILALGQDGAHRVYFASANGVQFYANGKSREASSEKTSDLTQNGVPLRVVDAFYRDPEGILWIGSLSGGLRMLENGKLSTFLMRDGLFDAEIYGIVGDQQDRLWMACSKGIFSVPRSDLRRFAAGELKKITSTPYSPTDALRVIECKAGVQPAASVSSDGRLWFSTIRGLIVFDPKHLLRKTPPPPLMIEDITVNGEREAPQDIGTLPPGRKSLEIRYTGLSFLAPGRITFRYMLENFDKNWIDAGTRREAYYTNLPPGTFHFRVTGCNSEGKCNETGVQTTFTLASHYYQRVWFWPLCAVALGMAIWLAYQLRIRRLREHFSLILAERNRIARELHDTLIQGLSGITMEMQALAARMRSPQERDTLDDIIQDAGTCLRETRRSVAGLRSGHANSGLASAIEQAARQLTETKKIRLKLKLGTNGKGLPADVEYNLVRIAQEAVTNSVKHSGARTVEVALDYSQRAVHLSVKDDGAGFAREENGHGRAGHYGLIGMKERASHIGAEFDLASTPGRGTVVSVTLPSGQNGNHE